MNQLQFVVFTNCVDYDGFKHQILNFCGFEFFLIPVFVKFFAEIFSVVLYST
jgi:hypothetical protein